MELVGEDRDYLKRTLSLVLPKTEDEKVTFDACFDRVLAFQDVRGEADEALAGESAEQDSEEGGDGEAAEPVATDRHNLAASAKRARAKVKTRTTF